MLEGPVFKRPPPSTEAIVFDVAYRKLLKKLTPLVAGAEQLYCFTGYAESEWMVVDIMLEAGKNLIAYGVPYAAVCLLKFEAGLDMDYYCDLHRRGYLVEWVYGKHKLTAPTQKLLDDLQTYFAQFKDGKPTRNC